MELQNTTLISDDYPEDSDEVAFEEFIHMADISKGGLFNEYILTNFGVAERDGKNLVFNNVTHKVLLLISFVFPIRYNL